jgi:hypothetical protein
MAVGIETLKEYQGLLGFVFFRLTVNSNYASASLPSSTSFWKPS